MSERKNVRAVQRREAQRRRERKTASVAAASAAVQHCFGEGREGRKEGRMEKALRIAFPNAEYACGVLHLSYLSVQPGPPLFPSLIAP